MNKALKNIFRFLLKTMMYLFIVFVLFLGSLFFREQKIPRCFVELMIENFSTEEFEFDCDDVYFGFRNGVRISGIKVFDRRNGDFRKKPVASIRNVQYDFMNRKVWAYGLKYHRLPDSYYHLESSFSPPSPVDFDIIDFDDITLVLESPEILGLTPDRVTARIRASSSGRMIGINDVEIVLPGKDCNTVLRGAATLDFNRQKISLSLRGSATQRQIRPFLEVLEIQCALPYMDAFTEIVVPVETDACFDFDLYSNDVYVSIDMKVPKMGRYNSVPLAYAQGGIKFHSKIEDDTRRVAVKVTLQTAADNDGRQISGWISLNDFSGKFKIHYDIKSNLRFDDALKIADFMDPDMLGFVRFDDAPSVTVKGVTGACVEDAYLNDITGEIRAGAGIADGFKFSKLNGVYTFKNDVFDMNAEMIGSSGGKTKFNTTVFCENFEEGKGRFALKGSYRDGSLEELAEAFSFDLVQRQGDIDIDLDVQGSISSNLWSTVDGSGRVKISDGHLGRMKLFAGLTELLAVRIPGVSFLVDQTQASSDFVFEDGVFRTDNIYIEGGLISIKGWGRYDIAKDDLDFVSRVQFLKKESIAGKVIHRLTYPLTKLLLEFKVTGKIDDPKWEYIQILDRIF